VERYAGAGAGSSTEILQVRSTTLIEKAALIDDGIARRKEHDNEKEYFRTNPIGRMTI